MKDTKTTGINCLYKVFTIASIILMAFWVIFDIFFAHRLAPCLPLLGEKFYEPCYTRNFKTDEILRRLADQYDEYTGIYNCERIAIAAGFRYDGGLYGIGQGRYGRRG